MSQVKKIFKDVWAKNVSAFMDENGDFGAEIQLYIYGGETTSGLETYLFSDAFSTVECYWNSMKNGCKCYEIMSIAKHIDRERMSEKNKQLIDLQNVLQQDYTEIVLQKKDFSAAKIRENPAYEHNQLYWTSLCWGQRMRGNISEAECKQKIATQIYSETIDWDNQLRGECFGFLYQNHESWSSFYNGSFYMTLVNWLELLEKGVEITPMFSRKYSVSQSYKALEQFGKDLEEIL